MKISKKKIELESQSPMERITSTILSAMEKHGTNWVKPWGGDMRMPVSVLRNSPYSGVNVLLLWAEGYKDHRWGTLKTWNKKGKLIKEGEKGTSIVWVDYGRSRRRESDDEDRRLRGGLKRYFVFNAEQVEGVEPLPEPEPVDNEAVDAKCQTFLDNLGSTVKRGRTYAAYDVKADIIYMPNREDFTGTDTSTPAETYFSTEFHEHIHWTRHPTRLDRKWKGDDLSNYAREELVAEIGAVYLCARLGVSPSPRPDHAQYLNHWMELLGKNNVIVIQAASKASKAVRFLEQLQIDEKDRTDDGFGDWKPLPTYGYKRGN